VSKSSFTKGEQFEHFVENVLFIKEDYILVHRTNNYEQNEDRVSEDTLKPDFKFRCRKTQKEFYVEAKFRSSLNTDKKVEILTPIQLERFKMIQQYEKLPIFIVVGFGGTPDNPKRVSLIPFTELKYLELYLNYLNSFSIEKKGIKSTKLNLGNFSPNLKEPELNKDIKPAKNTRKKIIVELLLIVLIFSIIFGYSYSKKDNIEKDIQQKVSQYYTTLELGNISGLDAFINPKVDKWYTKNGLTLYEIKKEATEYQKKYPNTKAEIQWDSFEVTNLNNDYFVSYKMVYKILSNGKSKDKVYHLRINAVWDKNLKLKSMYEVKL